MQNQPWYKEHEVVGNHQLHVTAILGEESLLKQLRVLTEQEAGTFLPWALPFGLNPLLLLARVLPCFKVASSCP